MLITFSKLLFIFGFLLLVMGVFVRIALSPNYNSISIFGLAISLFALVIIIFANLAFYLAQKEITQKRGKKKK